MFCMQIRRTYKRGEDYLKWGSGLLSPMVCGGEKKRMIATVVFPFYRGIDLFFFLSECCNKTNRGNRWQEAEEEWWWWQTSVKDGDSSSSFTFFLFPLFSPLRFFFFYPSFTFSFPLSCSFPCFFLFVYLLFQSRLFFFAFFFISFSFVSSIFFILSLLCILNNSFFNLSRSFPKISYPLFCVFLLYIYRCTKRGAPYPCHGTG